MVTEIAMAPIIARRTNNVEMVKMSASMICFRMVLYKRFKMLVKRMNTMVIMFNCNARSIPIVSIISAITIASGIVIFSAASGRYFFSG
ncbi:hypothetical protein A2642_04480 [Candidatus Nomurabacteria bacterium RIFCSPHIGHO2_01_FULL_39_10]|uniref:Uncharacterized protein n=1 Tax=Candidatus Nomurabacteria bacterium RIFCSPHIGHO2_01_FULL_39_10 TaxID=1801733 RepID=A0A1F6V4T3_9BACT|nr:MAG: hypothetical protein A2642_04480 [Candidatus Nomurabacteria bacterium RIFCSPHIGHO2_01_FULL_39_10]